MKKEKQKSTFDKLKEKHGEWEDFLAKGRIRMRKKLKKDKQEYYDFDYTRGQYYYNYPENHINFAPPEVQKRFFTHLITTESQDFSQTILHQLLEDNPIEQDMRPLQLYDFLRSYKQKLRERIVALRIKKSFYLRENLQKRKYVQLMESEIRSLVYRHDKVTNIFFKFSKPLKERMGSKASSLKLKTFDEMHFSEVDKSDFVVYLRMENARQRVCYPLDSLQNQLSMALLERRSEIEARCYEERCRQIRALEKQHGERFILRRTTIETHFMENSPQFLENEDNLRKVEEYLGSLNFVSQHLKNRNQSGRTYVNASKNLCQLNYVPGNEAEIKDKLFFICKTYFPTDMLETLYEHKREHLCYRLNYFASIMLRAISESYQFLVQIKEKQLHHCRSTMRRELQTIFTSEVDRLFGLPEHQIVLLVDQGSYQLEELPPPSPHQLQAIFEQYFKQHSLLQPTSKSILNLLESKNEKVIRQLAESYAKKVVQSAPRKLKFLSLYYRNLHTDQKSHLINILNEKLFFGSLRQNLLASKIDQIFLLGKLNSNLLQTVYILFLLHSIQLKTDLDNVLCAQISLMYELKYRMKLLKYKHSVPFEMSEEFLNRFTESNKYGQPFQYAAKTDLSNEEDYPDPQNSDQVVRRKVHGQTKVEVRRMMPQNALFEGKKILYREAVKESGLILQKVHKTCAYLVERRENYLNQQAFTGIVDKFQLVRQILQAELSFQTQKLAYLEELSQTLAATLQPTGIMKLAALMTQAKALQVFHNFSDFHCLQQYGHQAEICAKKAQIVKNLRKRLVASQERQAAQFREKIMKQNHVNNIPEISSIYYCDELPMEMEGDNIAEEDESCSQMSESHYQANSSKYKSDLSVISSDYHVKTTFKQILGRSSANVQAEEQNRREELMGKKKKTLINDSVLGGVLTYPNTKSYLHTEKVADLVLQLEAAYSRTFAKKDPGIERQYYCQAETIIRSMDGQYLQGQQFEETLLHRTLGDISRAISKVAEKVKMAPGAIEHYLFMNSDILGSLATGSSGTEINELRGLYSCLNIVQTSQMLYKYSFLTKCQHRLLQNTTNKLLANYSHQSMPNEGFFLSLRSLLQERLGNEQLKIVQRLQKSGQSSLQFCGNYNKYLRCSLLLNSAFLGYYKAMLCYLLEMVGEYELLKRECLAMEQYNCYFALGDELIKVSNIENKVFVKRKYELLCANQRKVLPSSMLKQFLQIPKSRFECLASYKLGQVQSDKSLAQNARKFERFMLAVAQLGAEMALTGRQVLANLKEKAQVARLQQLCRLLPYIAQHIKVGSDNTLLKDTFFQHYQQLSSFEKQHAKLDPTPETKLTLQYARLSVAGLSRALSPKIQKFLAQTLPKMISRKYLEFDQHQLNYEKYYHHLQHESYQLPYRWHNDQAIKHSLQYRAALVKLAGLRLWVQAKIVCFGAVLAANQLLQLRIMLQNPQQNFAVFWRDESSQLVRHADLVKMKYEDVDQLTATDHYTVRFITFQNLKLKYKQFLDCLSELDLKNQGLQILNLFYIGHHQFFKAFSLEMPQFLKDYCFFKTLKNQTSKFIDFTISTNPNRYLLASHKPLCIESLKTLAWNELSNPRFKQVVGFLDEQCGSLKQMLNCSNSKMNEMTNELSIHLFHHQRVKQMLDFLNICETKQAESDYSLFLKKYNEDLLLGHEKLSPLQKYLSKFVEKIVKEKPEMMHLKDEMLDKIYKHKFNETRVEERLFVIATRTLDSQVKLFKILLENYAQKQLLRENRIIKSTLNKVLVPKIIINPYLESPLVLENYFFAASLKLSYIDSFLNRLKNRAILVELTEGGFGYLLKINQLDQCVQSLCKGVITFAEKEFNDRFRTFVESFDQLGEKYRKAKIQNDNIKSILNICREEKGKQLTSLLYNKLDSYLLTFHTKEKTYNSVFNLLKSLEIEVSKKVSQSYLSKIGKLQQQNDMLKQQFVSFRKLLNHSTKMSMQQSKDFLYNSFKKEVQSILNKPVLKGYAETGQKSYESQETEAVQLLMKRLRTQKLFYQMKMSNLSSKIKAKNEQVNKLSEQIITLQNTLSSQQFKNTYLNQQIKHMHRKNIQIEELKREISKKQEQEIINKFKLIKINENLQGKLSRLEQKKSQPAEEDTPAKKRQEFSLGVQTRIHQSKEKKRFRIRTQHSQSNKQGAINSAKNEIQSLWRQKWQHSERKYQLLIAKVIQIWQKYALNKNTQQLTEKIKQISEQCLNNKIRKK